MTAAAPSGRAVLVAWTDIAAEEEEGFNDWYNREHVRDRVLGVRGFIRGRRFVAVSGGPKYLAIYETVGPEVLNSEAYIGLVSAPDPRSEHYILRFQNAVRTLGRLTASVGEAEGGFLAVLPLSPLSVAREKLRQTLAEEVMPDLLRRPGVVAATLIERDEGVRTASTKRHARQGDRSLDWALFVESADPDDLSRAVAGLAGSATLPLDPAFQTSLLRLAYRVDAYRGRAPA